MPASDFNSTVPQYPLNGGGAFGPNAILAYGRFYTASGGMVGLGQIQQNPTSATGASGPTGIKNAGPAGWPGMGATLVGTGRYNVMHPPSTVVVASPTVAAPSGRLFLANMQRGAASGFANGVNPATGITQIQVFESPTGGTQLANPPTGCRFDLTLYVAPPNTAGFTQF